MNKGRTFRTVGAGLLVSFALAACGGGGNGSKAPSALDPANIVPAGAVAYAQATIRPQGSIKQDLIEAINSIAGPGAAHKLSGDWAKSAHGFARVEPWLGQHMGIALTALPSSLTSGSAGFAPIESDVLIVFPSANPAAVRRALGKGHPSWERSKIEGHYLLLGGKAAIAAAQAVTAKTSLASDAGFLADMTQLGKAQLLSAYLPLHQLYEQVLPLLKSLPQFSGQSSALNSGAKQAPPGSSVAFGLSAPRNQFRVDVVEHGMPSTVNPPPTGVATDVSSLPASSWLAITLGGSLTKSGTVSKLAASVSKSVGRLQTLGLAGRVPSGPLQFIVKDLLPALGPAELSVSGSSTTTLQAGLVMDPVDKSAGPRLVRTVKQLVSGLPISATSDAGRVAVTFGFNSLEQLLNPSSKLAQSAAFKQALAQLPAGGKADVYLSFSGIAALAALDPSAGNTSTMRVLHRLNYLIAGGTHSHFRLVLATN